jgi:hypothetical protein
MEAMFFVMNALRPKKELTTKNIITFTLWCIMCQQERRLANYTQ